ncbi:MAG: hypothetical protein LBO03_02885 [Acidaminococcales bacterium]|jgi:hypothetical protein|nr:hypothetical protein [Acidaminococcales bacterium]
MRVEFGKENPESLLYGVAICLDALGASIESQKSNCKNLHEAAQMLSEITYAVAEQIKKEGDKNANA